MAWPPALQQARSVPSRHRQPGAHAAGSPPVWNVQLEALAFLGMWAPTGLGWLGSQVAQGGPPPLPRVCRAGARSLPPSLAGTFCAAWTSLPSECQPARFPRKPPSGRE